MLTGRPPFVGDSPVSIVYQHVNEVPEPPSASAEMPRAVETVVLRCLAKDPGRRFGSVSEVEAALARAAGAEPSSTLPLPVVPATDEPTQPVAVSSRERMAPSAPPGRPRRWPMVATGAVLVALAMATVALVDDGGRLRPRAAARESRSPTSSAATEGPTSVAAAFGNLMETIVTARAGGELEEEAGRKLLDKANDALEAYQRADAGEVSKAVDDLRTELARASDQGEVSVAAAGRIASALDLLVAAFEAEPPPTKPAEGEGEEGKGGEGGGPPPHAEANGHEDD
jgi:serine/threonine-protein kinase